jgi:hypothetical protein
MALPRPFVDRSYRTEAVDLQPYGNTISVTTGSDNPYERDQPVEIVTQQSGGMAGPDPRQRSKRVMHKGTAVKPKPHQAGHARTYQTRQAANRQGFMPGFGGFAGLGIDLPVDDSDSGGGGAAPVVDTTDFAALTALQDPGYMGSPAPGAAPIPVNQTQGAAYVAPPAAAAPAAAPAASGSSAAPGYLSALNALLKGGAQTTQAVLAAKQKAAVVAPPKSPVAALGAQAKAYWPYIAAGVGAVVVLGLLFGGGSRSSTVVLPTLPSPKTNPRHRRR